MQEYLKNVFARINIQQLRNFLFDGADSVPDNRSFEERTDITNFLIYQRLKQLYQDDEDEFQKVEDELLDMVGTYRDAYSEAAMKVGARLICQLLVDD